MKLTTKQLDEGRKAARGHIVRSCTRAEQRSFFRKPIEPDWRLSRKACMAIKKYKKESV